MKVSKVTKKDAVGGTYSSVILIASERCRAGRRYRANLAALSSDVFLLGRQNQLAYGPPTASFRAYSKMFESLTSLTGKSVLV